MFASLPKPKTGKEPKNFAKGIGKKKMQSPRKITFQRALNAQQRSENAWEGGKRQGEGTCQLARAGKPQVHAGLDEDVLGELRAGMGTQWVVENVIQAKAYRAVPSADVGGGIVQMCAAGGGHKEPRREGMLLQVGEFTELRKSLCEWMMSIKR